MRSMQRQPEATLGRQRVMIPRTAEEDGPSPKRLRTASYNIGYGQQQNNMTDNSLIAHLSHAASKSTRIFCFNSTIIIAKYTYPFLRYFSVSNDTSFSEFMGVHNSNMAFPLWPEQTRRVSLSSMSSGNQGVDLYFDDSMENVAQLPSRSINIQRERYAPINLPPTQFQTQYHSSDSSRFAQVARRTLGAANSRGSFANFHLSRPAMQSSSGYPDSLGMPQEITDLTWMGPVQAGPSSFVPPSMQTIVHHTQFPNSPNSSAWMGDELSAETFNNSAFDSKVSIPHDLPVVLALPEDRFKLSAHQVFLRHQIEAFKATEEDITTHTRGRNKKIFLGQVGIRCRYCAHVPVAMKQKGSVYYPSTLLGLYQAAQNISATHLQCGLCTQTPHAVKQHFVALLSTRAFSSGAGRPYWAQAAQKLGLVDTNEGIRFVRDVSPNSADECED